MNTVDDNTLKKISRLISHLSTHITSVETPDTQLYISGYYLDNKGYKEYYEELVHLLFHIPLIENHWALRSLQQRIMKLVYEVGLYKTDKEILTGMDEVVSTFFARNLCNELSAKFSERIFFTGVTGLILETPIKVGEVTFWSAKTKLPELQEFEKISIFPNLPPNCKCLASARISAEDIKRAELLQTKVEEALNVIRYMGVLIFPNEPSSHVYMAGKQPRARIEVVAVNEESNLDLIDDSLFHPVPIIIDEDFIEGIESYNFNQISAWISNQDSTPLQRTLISAIQWFGDATQELNPIQAFMKYYISIEMVLKKQLDRNGKSERAKKVIPPRMSYILRVADFEKSKKEIEDYIDERNYIFHEGKPGKFHPEHLRGIFKDFSRVVIHNAITIIENQYFGVDRPKGGWKSKIEFLDCIDKNLPVIK